MTTNDPYSSQPTDPYATQQPATDPNAAPAHPLSESDGDQVQSTDPHTNPTTDEPSIADNPYATSAAEDASVAPDSSSDPATFDPYANSTADPYSSSISADPYSQGSAAPADPYSSSTSADPYGQGSAAPADPYGQASAQPAYPADPYGQQSQTGYAEPVGNAYQQQTYTQPVGNAYQQQTYAQPGYTAAPYAAQQPAPYGATAPYGAAGYAPVAATQDDKSTASLMWWLTIVITFISPLIWWSKSPFVSAHAKQAMNVSLTALIMNIVITIIGSLTFGFGFLLIFLPFVYLIVMAVMGAPKASNGESFDPPMTIKFFK